MTGISVFTLTISMVEIFILVGSIIDFMSTQIDFFVVTNLIAHNFEETCVSDRKSLICWNLKIRYHQTLSFTMTKGSSASTDSQPLLSSSWCQYNFSKTNYIFLRALSLIMFSPLSLIMLLLLSLIIVPDCTEASNTAVQCSPYYHQIQLHAFQFNNSLQ